MPTLPGADPGRLRGRGQEPRAVSEAWDQPSDVLPVAVEVRWDEGVGSKVTQGTRCRESAAGTTAITCYWLIDKIDTM